MGVEVTREAIAAISSERLLQAQAQQPRLGLGTEPLLGRDPPQSLATAMHDAWVAFAAGGHCRLAQNTITPAGRRCASTRRRKLWTILWPWSSPCGYRPELATRKCKSGH
jgi:hypothetical protein